MKAPEESRDLPAVTAKTGNLGPVDSRVSRGRTENLDLLVKTGSLVPKDPEALKANRDLPVNEARKGNGVPKVHQARTHHPPYTFMAWVRWAKTTSVFARAIHTTARA